MTIHASPSMMAAGVPHVTFLCHMIPVLTILILMCSLELSLTAQWMTLMQLLSLCNWNLLEIEILCRHLPSIWPALSAPFLLNQLSIAIHRILRLRYSICHLVHYLDFFTTVTPTSNLFHSVNAKYTRETVKKENQGQYNQSDKFTNLALGGEGCSPP